MKSRIFFYFFIFVFCLGCAFSETRGSFRNNFFLKTDAIFYSNDAPEHSVNLKNPSGYLLTSRTINTLPETGIREDFPAKYREKFQKWKNEFLSTEVGREQWKFYAENKNFLLTFKVSGDKKQGAKTDEYLWDEKGNFVGATITLGSTPEKGLPDPVYYPVMNSLASSVGNPFYSVEGDVLAATKLAHEIGHVNQTFKETKDGFELKNKLTPVYISIFLKNGHNSRDEKLIELAEEMGGAPMKIWESREYWSEVNAMLFLKEKISREIFFCSVFGKIKTNVETYAKNYEDRFDGAQISVCKK